MKIISYNINDSYPWKVERLFQMQADILVVPDITCPEDAHIPDGYDMKWNGISYFYQFPRWKGLGVIWKKGCAVIPDWYNPNLYYAIPLLTEGILILAIWPTKRKNITDKKLYPQIAQEIINEYAMHFAKQPTIVVGDFNCYVNQVDSSPEYGDILRIDSILRSHGLHSIYHEQTGETFGEESTPTYYHRFKADQPFFLDYAYTNLPVSSFRLFPWDKDMSDHVGMELVV